MVYIYTMELNFDVDLVYLWCDGNDPEFLRKKQEAFRISGKEAYDKDSTSDFRFIDTEELKYSLRSAQKYAPWVRNIYIITYEQVPKWLNTNHPKIKIIDHKDIIPTEFIPTFNSTAIEIFIPQIPMLSEHFLLANDDTFFWNNVEKDFFFNNEGAPICRVQRRTTNKAHSLYGKTIDNAYRLILNKFKKSLMYTPHHGIDGYRKSDFIECINHFKEDFERTASHKFREMDDIQRIIVSFYAIAEKNAVVKENPKKSWYEIFAPRIPENAYTNCVIKKMKRFRGKDFKLFCINDCRKTKDKDRLYMKELLEEKFPEKSAYEL